MSRQFTEEDIQMENNHTKKMLNIICYQEDANETTRRYHYTPIRMGKIKNCQHQELRKTQSNRELSSLAGGNAKWYSHLGRQFGGFLVSYKTKHTLIQQSYPLIFTQRSWNLISKVYVDIYNSVIHNGQNFDLCPSADEWIHKLWDIQTVEYDSATRGEREFYMPITN